jgi:peptidoglycan/xylan/chitin deacetylase (PgdA/CDA1 family)
MAEDIIFKKDKKQPRFPSPEGKECAISLSFDDAHISQIDKGIPLLDKYNIKATFYISPTYLKRRIGAWKEALRNGHEIGNHTINHPCTGNFIFSKDSALENYTLEQMDDELDKANEYIKNFLGILPSSFAYPCGQKFVGRGLDVKSYVPLIAKKFFTGRGYFDESSNDPWFCDFSQLLAMGSDGKTFEELIKLIEFSKRYGQWLIFAGHKTKEGEIQSTSISVLEKLCIYLNNTTNGIWVDTIENIAKYIQIIRRQ